MVAINERIIIHQKLIEKQNIKRNNIEREFRRQIQKVKDKVNFHLDAIENLEKKKVKDLK